MGWEKEGEAWHSVGTLQGRLHGKWKSLEPMLVQKRKHGQSVNVHGGFHASTLLESPVAVVARVRETGRDWAIGQAGG